MNEILEVSEIFLEDELVLEIPEETSDGRELDTTLSYPCLIISGVTLEVEVEFLKERKIDEDNSLALYVDAEGLKVEAGRTDLNLDTLLTYHRLGYTMEICQEDGSVVDITDPSMFINFVRL